METITFNKDGGSLVVEITSGFAQPGSYRLKLWETDRNQVVMKEQGNFINDDDDAYTLPPPTASNDGRLLQATVILTILDPKKYFISVTVSQDGQEVGAVKAEGKTDEHSLFFNLMATLKTA